MYIGHKYPKQDLSVEVIAVDGGAYTGKSTVCDLISAIIGFPHFDSGILYRAIGYRAHQLSVSVDDVPSLVEIATKLDILLSGKKILLHGEDVTDIIRTEFVGILASKVSKIREVREALLPAQTRLRVAPGLVANGRDMAWVFDTKHMFYIHVDSRERARRKLLKEGKDSTNERLLIGAEFDILTRDHEDQTREHSPLRQYPDALFIYATFLTPVQLAELIIEKYYENKAF